MSQGNKVTKFLDNPTVTAVMNSGLGALPFGSLVASIMGTDAAGRQMDMVHKAAIRMQTDLENHIIRQKGISAEQLKMIQEVTLAVRESSAEGKLEYLINAFRNTLENGVSMSDYQATQLGRYIRDISADELHFLAKSKDYPKGIMSANKYGPGMEGYLVIQNTYLEDSLILQSLIRLGLVEQGYNPDPNVGGLAHNLNIWAERLLELILQKQNDQTTK